MLWRVRIFSPLSGEEFREESEEFQSKNDNQMTKSPQQYSCSDAPIVLGAFWFSLNHWNWLEKSESNLNNKCFDNLQLLFSLDFLSHVITSDYAINVYLVVKTN